MNAEEKLNAIHNTQSGPENGIICRGGSSPDCGCFLCPVGQLDSGTDDRDSARRSGGADVGLHLHWHTSCAGHLRGLEPERINRVVASGDYRPTGPSDDQPDKPPAHDSGRHGWHTYFSNDRGSTGWWLGKRSSHNAQPDACANGCYVACRWHHSTCCRRSNIQSAIAIGPCPIIRDGSGEGS